MNAKPFASELRAVVKNLKEKNGIESIKCDNLIAYLDEIINSSGSEIGEVDKEKYRAELQVWVERDKAQHVSNLEMFKSIILIGQNALKSAFLMNGGATVALLAFISKLSDQCQNKIPIFAQSLMSFVLGVLFITLASGITYLAQSCYAIPEREKIGHTLNNIVILFGLVSYGFFIWGAIVAYGGFMVFQCC